MESENLEINSNIKINHLAIWALVSAFFAFAFNYFFFEQAFGISLTIYGILVLIALFGFCYSQKIKIWRPALWLIAPFLFFCTMPAILANDFLVTVDMLAAFGIFLLLTRIITNDNIFRFTFLDYILTAIVWPLKFARHGIMGLSNLLRGAKDIPTGKGRQAFIGVVAAIPVLVFFGALFASADLAFRELVVNSIGFHVPENFFAHIILIVVIFVLCLGLFTFLLRKPADKFTADLAEFLGFGNRQREDRKIEVSIFLSLIGALFLVFIIFQIHYLFGGSANITFGEFTYAEYARKGFWELLVVAFSTLLILLAVDTYTAHNEERTRWFILPGLVVIAEVLIIIVSTFKRLALYASAYGMTELRLYVSWFIVFLAAVFILLAIKLLLKRRHQFFAYGTFVMLIASLVSLNLLNPHKYIADYNIDRFKKTGKIDAYYLTFLSADAVPTLVDQFVPLAEEDKILMQDFYSKKAENSARSEGHWQSHNLSKQKVLEKLEQTK